MKYNHKPGTLFRLHNFTAYSKQPFYSWESYLKPGELVIFLREELEGISGVMMSCIVSSLGICWCVSSALFEKP